MRGSTINNKGKEEKNKKVKAGPCIFPFKFKWKIHDNCYTTEKGDICATEVNSKGTLLKYGYCIKRKTIKVPKRYKNFTIKIKRKIDDTEEKKNKDISTKSIIMEHKVPNSAQRVLNDEFIQLLDRLHDVDQARGKVFEALAYKKAAESIMAFPEDIVHPEQIKHLPGIGKKIFIKLNQYLETGTVPILEKEKDHPRYIFYKIYGVGPKKAIELVDKDGITTLEELRKNPDVLNDTQKIGLKYYDDILKRIPRAEIETFEKLFNESFKKIAKEGDSFEIVGSYRRGNATSGDIDVIITSSSGNRKVYKDFITQLHQDGVIIEFLSKGATKSLTIGKLPDSDVARRLDFMYAPPKEFAFSTLYFTGSKAFNVVQRKHAHSMGMTMNEHGLYKLIENEKGVKKKGERIKGDFPTEQSIFDFLGLVYKTPKERKNGKAVVIKSQDEHKVKAKKRTTIKIAPSLKVPSKNTAILASWKLLSDEGISAVKGFTEDHICDMLRYASDVYYNSGDHIVTDSIYDILKEYGQQTYPKNPCFVEIGAPTNKKKVALPYFLGSMNKIKPDTSALLKYFKKYPGPKEISAKLDGISALYTTEGDHPRMYTRGGATNGLDISYIIPYMVLPQEKGVAIRGELIIDQKIFNKKYSAQYKNPRNMVSGVIASSKKHEIDKWKDIDFVAYEVIKPTLKPSEQMEWLEKNGVITVLHETVDEISNEMLSTLLVKWRDHYKYEIDGIIVTDDKVYPRRPQNPDHAFAFKMVLSDQIAEVKVIDVIWAASKDGYLKPVVRVEPVRLRGADIEWVTAFNAKFVQDNKIGIGAVIQLIRSGEVIPHIQAVIQPAETAKMPSVSWHWNETRVDAVTDLADDPDVLHKNIEYFFKTLDVAGMGPGNVKRLVSAGYNTVPKILAMTQEDLLTVPGFKEKTATKIHTNIHKIVNAASLATIASGSNIFGRGIGLSILRNIIHEYPNIFESAEDNETKIAQIAQVDNVGQKRAVMFVSKIPNFIAFMANAKLTHKFKEQESTKIDKDHPLYGKRIVITGPKDKSLKKQLVDLGVKIGTSVNGNTFAVLIEHASVGDEGKKAKAKELKIPIITFEEFRKRYL